MRRVMLACKLFENKKPRLFASAAVYEYSDIPDLDTYDELYWKMNKKLDNLMLVRFRDTLAKEVPSFKNKSLEDIRNIMNAMIALGWCELKEDRQGWPEINLQINGANNAN